MKDPEFIALRNKFFLNVLIATIFIIPITILIFNKFSNPKPELLKNIGQEKNLIIFLTENNCQKCHSLKNTLNNNNISYFELNKDKDPYFKEIMLKIEMPSNYALAPGIIYIEKGKMLANKVELKNSNDLETFLSSLNLIKGSD